jgi:hypothetical protein
MDETQLLAIMAAIIYAGADDSQRAAGYTPVSAAVKAQTILREVKRATGPEPDINPAAGGGTDA